MEFTAALRRVRDAAPLVQCITNFVTVNDCANIIPAAGGSPPWQMTSGRQQKAPPVPTRWCATWEPSARWTP